MGESMAEFVDRRRREVSRFGRQAEAAAHDAYGKAIRAGQDLKLASPGEVMRHGVKVLQENADRAAGALSGGVRDARQQAGQTLRRASQDPAVRSAAVVVARRAGNAAGVVRGGVHAVEGLAAGAMFTGRLLNPLDPLLSPEGESANEQLRRASLNAGRKTIAYVRKGVADPGSVVRDVNDTAQRWRRDLDPSATPAAPTFEGELRRNFDIGQNQGELAFDVGSLVVGGPAAKMVKGLPRLANLGNDANYLAQGASPRAAAHLAKPYPQSNMGSHFIPRRFRLPEMFGGGPLPRSYLDGPFNKLAPPLISRGDLYALHYEVDPHFYGTSVLGERWSGRDLGLRKHGPMGRLWYGSPAPLKARVGGLGASAGATMYIPEEEETAW
ncbi:MAG: hypothetical protein ABW360_16970 [Phenylobacterium sp.]